MITLTLLRRWWRLRRGMHRELLRRRWQAEIIRRCFVEGWNPENPQSRDVVEFEMWTELFQMEIDKFRRIPVNVPLWAKGRV